MIKEQPLDMMRKGKFSKSKKIILGQTSHETENYVRSLFKDPINDFGMVYGCRALFHGLEDGNEIVAKTFQKYNELGFPAPSCNSTIGDWSPVGTLPEVFQPTFKNTKYSEGIETEL